jgi:hypothetical protein
MTLLEQRKCVRKMSATVSNRSLCRMNSVLIGAIKHIKPKLNKMNQNLLTINFGNGILSASD